LVTSGSRGAPATTGDLKFSLTVNDGINNSVPSTLTVHVIDLAPVVSSVVLSPSSPRRNDPISVAVNAGDPDGDSITLSYVWSRNGTVVAGATGTAYPLGNQVKNDTISVVVTASDGTLTGTGTASVVIADTPATLASNAPTSAVFGAAGSFQVAATDVDGDPTGAIELAYGPAGMTVSSSGQVSWTPSGPLFDRTVNMNWGVRLHDTPTITLSGTITVTDPNRKYPLVRTNVGLATGSSSLDVEDFAGDGNHEMLIGAEQSVFLLQKNGTDYDQIWAYPFDTASGDSIAAVASGDVNGDGHREIFFSAGPVVVELDGVTRREVARYGTTVTGTSGSTSSPYCVSLKVADIDNDGIAELVCLGMDSSYSYPATGRIYVFNAQTMQLKWMTDDLVLGTSMAVGNVDSDPALEIVTSGGYVFDGATGANQWAYAPGFGSQVDIGDVIGDGVGKILGTASAGLTAYDAVQKTVLWSIPPGISGFSAIKVAELDGTAPAEIIAADGQWGNVTVFRYTSGAPQVLTQINSIGDGVTAIATGDVNGDGLQEIVWTPTFSLTNASPSVAISSWTPTATLLWTGPLPIGLDGPFVCAKQGRVSASQSLLIYMTPGTEQGYSGMRVIGLDPATGFFTVSQQVDSNWADARACDVADVYGNGVDSVLLSTATLYNPYFTAFDFESSVKQWSSPQLSGTGAAVTHADVNGDGVPDLIGITTDGHLYAWDVRDQTLIWSISGIGTGVNVAVGDVYGDGNQEIIALTTTQALVFTQSSTGLIQRASYSVAGTDLLVADTNGDGKAEIYVLASGFGSSNASVYQLDGSLTLLNSYPVGSAVVPASSLYLEESAFPRKNIVVALSSASVVYTVAPMLEVIDPMSGTQIWESPPLRGYVPPNSLNFYDLNGNGQLQMVFGTSVGMYVTQ
jgi:FG-GAP-like repeat